MLVVFGRVVFVAPAWFPNTGYFYNNMGEYGTPRPRPKQAGVSEAGIACDAATSMFYCGRFRGGSPGHDAVDHLIWVGF